MEERFVDELLRRACCSPVAVTTGKGPSDQIRVSRVWTGRKERPSGPIDRRRAFVYCYVVFGIYRVHMSWFSCLFVFFV